MLGSPGCVGILCLPLPTQGGVSPAWHLLPPILDRHGVGPISGWGIGDLVGAITIVSDLHWLWQSCGAVGQGDVRQGDVWDRRTWRVESSIKGTTSPGKELHGAGYAVNLNIHGEGTPWTCTPYKEWHPWGWTSYGIGHPMEQDIHR